MLPLFLSLLIFSSFLSRECSSQEPEPRAPAIYVFGDSLSDAGNNNALFFFPFARANYPPYGINFPNSVSTGRYTDGKTFPDFIADYLGLPLPLANRGNRGLSTTGYTYASGGCGILNETGEVVPCVSLHNQLIRFQNTIDEELVPRLGDPSEHLANSIFIVWAGSNDYLLNYFKNPGDYTPEQFADHLINQLSTKLEKLHELGARKFVLLEVGPLGCIPVYRKNGGHDDAWCDESKNDNAKLFNQRLALMHQTLASTYADSYFTLGNIYELSDDAFRNPAKYGFSNVSSSCCVTSVDFNNLPCRRINPSSCEKPEEYLFWDGAHPTQASFQILATPCISGSNVCAPYNIQQLVQLKTNVASLHSAA